MMVANTRMGAEKVATKYIIEERRKTETERRKGHKRVRRTRIEPRIERDTSKETERKGLRREIGIDEERRGKKGERTNKLLKGKIGTDGRKATGEMGTRIENISKKVNTMTNGRIEKGERDTQTESVLYKRRTKVKLRETSNGTLYRKHDQPTRS